MTKIIYDSDKKSGVINNLNRCIDDISDINNILFNINIPYGFYYTNTLKNIKSALIDCKDDLIDYKNSINKYMKDMNKNELELSSKINKIEDVVVQKFD